MISRRKLFAFASAVAVSPKAVLSADAEIGPTVEMTLADLYQPPSAVDLLTNPRAWSMNISAFRDILMEGLKEFDGAYSPMQYYDSWQQ